MNVSNPASVISHRLDNSVARVLAGTTRPLTGHQVARLVPEASQPGVWKALNRLVAHGLVRAEDAGNSILYELNREHLAAPAVEVLASLRSQLFSRMKGKLNEWTVPALHAYVFGSVARGDGSIGSDIDLLLIRPVSVDEDDPAWRTRVDETRDAVERWTGNRLAVSEVPEEDVERLRRERPPIIDELASDAVKLVGSDVTTLFGAQP